MSKLAYEFAFLLEENVLYMLLMVLQIDTAELVRRSKGGKMSAEERIAALEKENGKLREDNDRLLKIIAQMEMTLNRLIGRYITEN